MKAHEVVKWPLWPQIVGSTWWIKVVMKILCNEACDGQYHGPRAKRTDQRPGHIFCCYLRISPHQSTLPCLGYEAHQGVTNINNNNSQSNNNNGYHCPVCLPCPGSSDPAIPPREASLTFWHSARKHIRRF